MSSRQQHLLLWALALAVIALGVWLSSIRYGGHEWLSRAGCVVVILGILSGMGGIIHERFLLSRVQLRRRREIAHSKRLGHAGKLSQEALDETLAEIDKRFAEQTAAIEQDLRLSVGVLEVSLLITGTFLWGFGDLFTIG